MNAVSSLNYGINKPCKYLAHESRFILLHLLVLISTFCVSLNYLKQISQIEDIYHKRNLNLLYSKFDLMSQS